MFGLTFSNLDNEVQFLRRSMGWVNREDIWRLMFLPPQLNHPTAQRSFAGTRPCKKAW